MISKEQLLQKILIYDIECWSSYDIKNEFEKYVDNAVVRWVGFYSYKYNEYYLLEVSKDKNTIKDLIKDHEIVVGFNNKEFDTPIMKNNDLVDYCRELDIRHILIPDGKNLGIYMGFEIEDTSLNGIAEMMGCEFSKGDIDYNVFAKERYTPEEKKDIETYLKRDIELTKFVFEKIFDFYYPFAEWMSLKNVLNYSWMSSKISVIGYKVVCNILKVEEEYGEKGEKDPVGGYVIEPRVDEATDVWYVDVASMYPHNYVQFNLFDEVYGQTLAKLSAEEKSKLFHGNDVFKVEGYYRVDREHLLTIDVKEKLVLRIDYKRKDPKNPKLYALKIYLNSIYGANRSPVFTQLYTPHSGRDCCSIGQQINHIMEKMANEMGYDVIYGDTDSNMWVHKTEKKTHEQVTADIKKIVDYIKANVPFPCETFDIAIENHLDYISFNRNEQKAKKKNYYYVYTDKNGEKQVKIMGLPIIKRNGTALGKKILNEVLIDRIKNGEYKFGKLFLINLINEKLKEDLSLVAQEYRCATFDSYGISGKYRKTIWTQNLVK